MNWFIRIGFSLTVIIAPLAAAQPSAPTVPNYSHAEIKQMIRTAHTGDQYQELATYYRARQQSFKQQARSEKTEWVRRILNETGPAEKYPRPVDSSRNRYEYFEYEAGKMGEQAARYEGLLASSSSVSPR